MKKLIKTLLTSLVLTAVAGASLISASAAPVAYGAGTVAASALNVRDSAGPTGRVSLMLRNGDSVVILEKTNDSWYHVAGGGTVGYVASSYLTNVSTVKNLTASGTVIGTGVRLRSQPSTNAAILGTYNTGAAVNVTGINNGWYKVGIGGTTGYIRSDLVSLSSAASAAPASAVSTGSAVSVQQAVVNATSLGQQIADFAKQFAGYKYVYGAESPSVGFDCSGLTYYVYGHFGYSLQRRASMQYKYNGTAVAKEDLMPGDLVFFSSDGVGVTHVGLYYGDGKFVNASTERTGVIISSLSSSYYTRTYWGARRIVG